MMNRCWGTLLLLCLTAGTAQAESELVLLPQAVQLHGREARTQLLLQRRESNEFRQQVTAGIRWESRNPEVAKVTSDGEVRPVADGKTTIVARVGEQTAAVPVEVTASQEPFTWSFRRHVQPLLAKLGCNSGACHGALAGKGGFRLSLRGYDPASDYFNIVKQDRGRRVELSAPGRSLFLAKPSGAIPHKGGLRFEPDSLEYRNLSEWIASGAAPPAEDDTRVERIEVLPGRSLHQVGETQQMLVLAHFSDGTQADVTRWAIWSSTNEAVCMVEKDGSVTVIGPGEGAVVGWYASQIAIARITVPFTAPETAHEKPQVVDQREPRNFIDEHVDRQLVRLNLPASPACSDSEFIRRAYVDTIGLLPTAEDVTAFLADTAEDKRDRLIEELLGREEFVDYWTYQWSDVLMLNGTLLRPEALKAYYEWIRGHVEKNTPWDQTIREVLTATGNSFENGATNFYALHQTPEDMTENASQAFLGLSISCAKCHDHPLEKWTNDQYYGMANLFARVKAKGWGGESRNGDGLRTLYVVSSGELVQPRTGKPQPPTPLDGESLSFDDPTDRRVHLAEWLTAPENPYFARSITNRVWANYFGVGLVENVDDMRVSNPASNEELLAAAAGFVVEKKFDLKELMPPSLEV
ncbi:MAG: DUF1549 domain-containing protein, partial [Maioricimonas sp. JB049]